MSTEILQSAKNTVRALHATFDVAAENKLAAILSAHATLDYSWRGVHPFNEQPGVAAAVENFWLPLRRSLAHMQRREDIFMAGRNTISFPTDATCS